MNPDAVPGREVREYVNEFAPTAFMVREVGVTRTPEEDQAKVMGSSEAILKKEVEAWGGWVIEMIPTGAVAGMELEVDLDAVEFPVVLPVAEADVPLEEEDMVVVVRPTWRSFSKFH